MDRALHRFLINIYGYSFFNTLTLLSPVYAVFMQSHGMSDFQISTLLILWSVGVLITQIPVTWAANRCGAKNVLFAGQAFKAFAFLLWLLWPTYAGFAIGMILWGMQGAIYNVVSEDLLYDELRVRTHGNVYARVLGVRRNVYIMGSLLSSAGSLLLFFGYEWITAASVVSLMVSMLFIMRLRITGSHDRGAPDAPPKPGFFRSLTIGTRMTLQTPVILMMLLLSVAVTNFSYLNDYLSLIGYNIGLAAEYIGVVPFCILICQMIGQAYAHRFANIRGLYLYPFLVLAGALFVLFSVFYNLWGLALLGLAYIICSALKIVLFSRFQDLTPTRYRLEILSLYSISDQATYMLVCLIIGLGGMMGSWRYSVLILGIVLVVIGVWATLFVGRRRQVSSSDFLPTPGARPSGPDMI